MDQPLHHSDAKGVFWHSGFKTNKFQMKRKFNHFYLSLLGGALLTLGACSKNDNVVQPQVPTPDYMGLYILNEGSSPSLNSTLGFISYGSNSDGSYNENLISGSIGQGANDLIRYGSKLYVSATNTNTITVIETYTHEVLKTIQLESPRYLLPYRGKVYATNGDNQLTAIDTSSYETSSIEVGRSPEQLAATGGKIYVTNSGWKDALAGGSYDNRLSVINSNSFAFEKNITVANNINTISADTSKNMLYVNAAAIYSGSSISSPSKLYTVNTSNDEVKALNFGAENIEVLGQSNFRVAYLISSNYTDGQKSLLVMSLDNQQVQTISGSGLTDPYSINYIPEIGALIFTDAKGYSGKGTISFLNSSGQISGTQEVGVVPKKVVFSHSNEDIAKILNQ